MRCPFCGHMEEKVVDSREARDGEVIRRRRQCLNCGRRFTTYERIEEIQFMVVKRDDSREPFDRNKVLSGLLKATQKRPVSVAELEKIADEVEARLLEKPDREITWFAPFTIRPTHLLACRNPSRRPESCSLQ